ncbi:uncharacterized protein WCC33_011473 [Rhinophrynus dorsalis]
MGDRIQFGEFVSYMNINDFNLTFTSEFQEREISFLDLKLTLSEMDIETTLYRKPCADNIIFHELFCYDVYVVSPPCPQNARQRGIDEYMMENIVKPLEQQGYKCYHGSRNIIGGELILQAMSYPITIIPITIVPVFKDNSFSTFRNLLLRPDYLERIVFLSFDSTTLYPPVVSKISYSISVKDECLLQKLMETIKKKRTQIPLQKRKRKCEMGIDPDPFRRSDRSRISFLIRPTNKSRISEEATSSVSEFIKTGTIHGYLQLMKIIMDLHIVRRNKNKKLKTIFKHYFQKLVYHPLKDVREFVTPFLFSNDLNSIDICHLGSVCVRINEDVAETCIREKLASDFPDMILTEKLQTTSNALIFKAKIQNCDVLLYTFKQKTLNDVLQTNSSDDAYETFQEMSTALKKCQGNDYIVERLSVPSNCILPFYVVQQGKPLLHFLHEKENQLTWSQMIGILIDITKAVQHCHNNCVILRDITPACFMVFPTADGSFKTKLANFLYAKCLSCEDDASSTQDYVNEMDSLCFQGDDKEPVAAYFSAPETLKNKTFSKCTDIWMLNVTFYSILLYGRQPYQELSHLNVSQFVKEIISGHKPEIPNSFSKDLCKILEANLNHEPNERMLSQQLLHELETCKNNFDDFVQEKIEEPSHRVYSDYTKWNNNRLSETVSVRMGLNIKRKLKAIDHENILQVETIESDSYTTTLVYYPFENDIQTLNRIHATSKSQLLSYLDQLTLALQNLHSQNILHCNLRGNHVYVNPNQNTIKLGHFGRAVTLEGKQTHPYVIKMMPHEAEKWSAPEVKAKGMYSKASDIFSLAVVFWEVISTQISPEYYNLKLFVKCSDHELLLDMPEPHLWLMIAAMWYGDSCSTSEDSIYESTYTYCDEEEMLVEDEEPPYETIIDCTAFDFSLNYAWKYVIYEFVSTQGSAENTTKLIDYKETSEYEDVGIQWSKKRNNPGIIL